MESIPLDFLGDLRRTHSCGELRETDSGKHAVLMGWVHRRRDLGGVIFIHLRDREGVTQVVFRADKDAELLKKAEMLGAEYVVAVEGLVEERTADTVNPAIPTGTEEVFAAVAVALRPARILLACDVDGVLDHDPAGARDAKVVPVISAQNEKRLLRVAGARHAADVTGGMAGKVRSLRRLAEAHAGVEIRIFSGLTPGAVAAALRGKSVGGTLIR